MKSWVFRFSRNGRVTDLTIGHWPEISLLQARAIVRKKQRELEIEPTGSFTVRDAFKFWCTKKKGRILSYRDERLRLEKYVISKIGSRQLDSVTPPMIIRLMEPLEEEGKASTIKRLLMRTREIFDMTVNAGYLTSNPLSKITKVFPVPAVTHMPAVDWKELPNSRGAFRMDNLGHLRMCAFANGVFYTSEPYPRSMVGTPDADGTQDSYVNMDLSRNSSVYSDSISTVQVDALLGQYLIRYAA